MVQERNSDAQVYTPPIPTRRPSTHRAASHENVLDTSAEECECSLRLVYSMKIISTVCRQSLRNTLWSCAQMGCQC